MANGKEINLAKHRLEQARECLKVSEANMEISFYVVNYQCSFCNMKALHAGRKGKNAKIQILHFILSPYTMTI